MELRDLRYFLAIAELGQVNRAADRAGRTQPALSKSIRRLEEQIGARLVVRNGRALQLTAVGEALLIRARAVCQLVDESTEELASVAQGNLGLVRIGTVPTAADSLLPAAFKRLTAEQSKIKFQVTLGMTDLLRKLLRTGEVDLVVCPLLDSDKGEFGCRTLGRDDLVVAARKQHGLTRRSVRLRDLLDYEWLLSPQSNASRQWLEQRFRSRNLPAPVIRVETNSVRMLRETVAQTDLITFMSRRDLKVHGEPELVEIALPETTMKREMGVLYPRDRLAPPAIPRVIEALVSGAWKGARVVRRTTG
jgi:DNA-binding transcriptional LysR family regulator